MIASEAKEIADKTNKDLIDRADGELDHIYINIQDAANNGDYNTSYALLKNVEYAVAVTCRNELKEMGYDVTIEEDVVAKTKCWVLIIDWSL